VEGMWEGQGRDGETMGWRERVRGLVRRSGKWVDGM